MDGLTIICSCFSQQIPDSEKLPPNLMGVTFINCNLDNLVIPPGNLFVDCSTRRFVVQNDLNDWEIDDNDDPVRVTDWEYFQKFSLPQPAPEEIPDEVVSQRIDYRVENGT